MVGRKGLGRWGLVSIGLSVLLVCLLAVVATAASAQDTTTITGNVVDTTPPAAVTDLAVTSVTATSLTLTWTAPGDDGTEGTAAEYDIRYSTSTITEANWDSATQCSGEPAPQPAGSSESFTVTGLNSGTTYYFGLKTADEACNWSELSNIVPATTSSATPPAPAPPGAGDVYIVRTDLFGRMGMSLTNDRGELLRMIGGTSPDGNLSITIPQGTIAKEADGTRLLRLSINAYESPPDPPAGARIIGLAYDFQPKGATFNPPMTLTWKYDPDALGDVAEDSLVLAYYDEAAGVWVELESVVDTENNTITARVSHFTVFAMIGRVPPPPPPPPPVPAEFAVSSLAISPGVVYVDDTLSIRVLVTNTGGESGSYCVTLKINGVIEATEDVTVSAGLSKEVTFSVARDAVGLYSVDVNGLTGSFTVTEVPPTPEQPTPTPTPEPTPTPTPEPTPTPTPEPAPPAPQPWWATLSWYIWVIIGVVIVAIGTVSWLIIRRRREWY